MLVPEIQPEILENLFLINNLQITFFSQEFSLTNCLESVFVLPPTIAYKTHRKKIAQMTTEPDKTVRIV